MRADANTGRLKVTHRPASVSSSLVLDMSGQGCLQDTYIVAVGHLCIVQCVEVFSDGWRQTRCQR